MNTPFKYTRTESHKYIRFNKLNEELKFDQENCLNCETDESDESVNEKKNLIRKVKSYPNLNFA